MSVEALAIVLHHSRAKGTPKLVMVGIANHDGDGGSWPAVATLAVYANVSRANVQKALRVLERLGEVHVDTQGGGLRSTPDFDRTNLYRVLLKCPPNCDGTTAHRMLCTVCGRKLDHLRRLHATHVKCVPKPASAGGASEAIPRLGGEAPPASEARPEPSFNPTTNHDIEIDAVVNREGNSADASPKGIKDASGGSQTTADADGSPTWMERADLCPKRAVPSPHAIDPRTGLCIDCKHTPRSSDTDVRNIA